MRGFAVLSAVLLQACLVYGYPGPSEGVGAFAYQDTVGNRYGGTYGLRDGQVVDVKGDYPPPEFVAPPQWGTIPNIPTIPDIDNFFPEYFRNFEYLIQQAFGSNFRNQKIALHAARKAYDLTSNQVGIYSPSFDFRFPPIPTFNNRNQGPSFNNRNQGSSFNNRNQGPSFNNRNGGPAPFDMSENSAFAGAAAGPGFSHHIAAINPENPQSPNVEVTKTYSKPNSDGFYSVSSSSYSSSSNIDGQVKSQRGAETKINNNGEITHYKVQN